MTLKVKSEDSVEFRTKKKKKKWVEELQVTHLWFASNLTYPLVILFLTLYPSMLHSVTIHNPPLFQTLL